MRPEPPEVPAAAVPEFRRLLARVAALDLVAVTAAPTGDRAHAAACLARWQHAVHALVDPDGTVHRAVAAIATSAHEVADLRFLERRFPPPLRPTPCTLAWAEAPLDLLVDPAVLTDADSLDCHGWYHGGLTSSYVCAIDHLFTVLLPHRHTPAQTITRHLPDSLAPRPVAADSPSAAYVRDLLHRLAVGIIMDMLTLAQLHPRIPHNPYEHEFALIERGLYPLAIADGQYRVFRPAAAPVVVPDWLPEFTLARPPT